MSISFLHSHSAESPIKIPAIVARWRIFPSVTSRARLWAAV